MKKLIIILSILFSIAEMQAQTITYTPQAAAGYRFKYAIVDSGFTVPFGDTTTGRGSVRPGAIKLFEADSLLYFWNGLKWTKVNIGGISGPDIDSIVFTASTICKWFEGASNCFDLSLVHANATLNFNSTGIIFYNLEGTALPDSVALPHTDVYDGSEIYWVDSAGGVIAKLRAGAGGGGGSGDTTCGDSYITPDSIYWVRLYCDGSIRDSIQWNGAWETDGSGGDIGYFTSTGTAVTNVTSTTAAPVMRWTKTGSFVHVAVSGTLTPTSTGATEISLTLPYSTTLTSGTLLGVGTIAENAGTSVVSAYAYVSDSTTIILRFISTVATSGSYFLTLDYPN